MDDNAIAAPLERLCADASSGNALKAATEAIESPDLYTFGELLALANVQALSTSKPDVYKALSLLAYGTCDDYFGGDNSYTLNDVALRKLRQLTVISAANESAIGHLNYDDLRQRLRVADDVELESLIIDGTYRHLFKACFDSHKRTVYVTCCIGRDVRPDRVDDLVKQLQAFVERCSKTLDSIDCEMTSGGARVVEQQRRMQRLNDEYQGARTAAVQQMESYSATDSRAVPSTSTSAGGGKVSKRFKQQTHSQSPQPRNMVGLASGWLASKTGLVRRNASGDCSPQPRDAAGPSSSQMNGGGVNQ